MPYKDKEREKARQRAYARRWRAANPELERERQRAYYATHQANKRCSNGIYRANRPEAIQAKNARRRARLLAVPSNLTAVQWKAIILAYRGRCAYCGKKPKKLTQDHVVPLARHGTHTADNIVPSCLSCNLKKNTGPPQTLPALRLLL